MQKLKKNLKPGGRKRVVLTGRSEILDRTGPGRPVTVTGYNYTIAVEDPRVPL
jgi:hypothetical protein